MATLIPQPQIQYLTSANIPLWVRETLFNKQRTVPIIAVTSLKGSGEFPLSPSKIQTMVGSRAQIVVIETGQATRDLAAALPPNLGVYGGALRIWWPGVQADSNIHNHRLFILDAYSTALQKQSVLATVDRELKRNAGLGVPMHSSESILATVVRLEPGVILLNAAGDTGELIAAPAPVPAIAACLEQGMKLRVHQSATDAGIVFSGRDTLPRPWELLDAHLKVGDVVEARVVRIDSRYALLEFVPGAQGLCPLSEIDWGFVSDIAKFLEIDEIVRVKILAFNPRAKQAEFSVKQAAMETVTAPLPSLVPSGLPFSWERYTSLTTPVEAPPELAAAPTHEPVTYEECDKLRTQTKQLKVKLIKEQKQKRRAEDRLRTLEKRLSRDLAPFDCDQAFLQAVRVEYARTQNESDRQAFVLGRMRVGPDFLKDCRELDGIDPAKIIQVCAEVASDRAKESAGRQLHPFLEGRPGTKQRIRKRDGAKAYRCALQIGTASARRLMYWVVCDGETKTFEFANVGTHDDMRITEA